MKEKPSVSVVIRTKNEEKYFARLMRQLHIQTFRPSEIIVVDNNSTDNTLAIAE